MGDEFRGKTVCQLGPKKLQLRKRRRVKSPDRNVLGPQGPEPRSKLGSRTVGVGKSKYPVRGVATALNTVGDAVANSSGFSTTSTCNYGDRSLQGLGGRSLIVSAKSWLGVRSEVISNPYAARGVYSKSAVNNLTCDRGKT